MAVQISAETMSQEDSESEESFSPSRYTARIENSPKLGPLEAIKAAARELRGTGDEDE